MTVDPYILSHARHYKDIIHGAKSLNRQVSEPYRRSTEDWDLWAKAPAKESDVLQSNLDRGLAGGQDIFYVEQWVLEGTKDTPVYRVKDRRSGKVVADFMHMPSNIKGIYKVLGGVRWETLTNMKKQHKAILANPALHHRHAKSLRDLQLIEAFEKKLDVSKNNVPLGQFVFNFKPKPFRW